MTIQCFEVYYIIRQVFASVSIKFQFNLIFKIFKIDLYFLFIKEKLVINYDPTLRMNNINYMLISKIAYDYKFVIYI